jgi:hypothetical protein
MILFSGLLFQQILRALFSFLQAGLDFIRPTVTRNWHIPATAHLWVCRLFSFPAEGSVPG